MSTEPTTLRPDSPKVSMLNTRYLVGAAVLLAVFGGIGFLSVKAPETPAADHKPAAPVASSVDTIVAALPTDYAGMAAPAPAPAVFMPVKEPAREPEAAPEPTPAPAPPQARCVPPPNTYRPGELHRAQAEAAQYRDCLAQRAYARATHEQRATPGGGLDRPAGQGTPRSTVAAAPAPPPATAPAAPGVTQASMTGRDRHEDFHARVAAGATLYHEAQPEMLPVDACVVPAGYKIPAALSTGINSGAAGSVAAQTTQDVYDTTGNCLAIPAGSRLLGTYDHITGYGQRRVAIAWEILTLPDGRTVSVAGLPGADAAGTPGVRGHVNNHNLAFLGAVLLGSFVDAAPALAGLKANVALGGPAAEVSSAGRDIIRRELQRQPTITVPAGTEVTVDVRRHLVMGEL